MALTDVTFQEGDIQDFIVELPSAVYGGSLEDMLIESDGAQFSVMEIPEIIASGSNIFIMSE
jgi:hypothetical protein